MGLLLKVVLWIRISLSFHFLLSWHDFIIDFVHIMTQMFPENCLLWPRRVYPAAYFFCTVFFLPHILKAQTTIVTDSPLVKGTTVVIPGQKFNRSGFHNLFWGRHYRKEWTTPVRVSNFYIDTAAGGLIVTAESGSRQSRGLRLKSSNGKQYVLRSLTKISEEHFPIPSRALS